MAHWAEPPNSFKGHWNKADHRPCPPSQDPAVASLQGTRKVFALKIHGAVGSQGLPCTDGTQTLTVATKHPQVGQRFGLLVAWVC